MQRFCLAPANCQSCCLIQSSSALKAPQCSNACSCLLPESTCVTSALHIQFESTLVCRRLTSLSIKSGYTTVMPQLPPTLEELCVKCSRLQELPALPPTLRKLRCSCCFSLKALPLSLSSTAVTELIFHSYPIPESLRFQVGITQLPSCLVNLDLFNGLLHVSVLPQGLTSLTLSQCEVSEVSSEYQLTVICGCRTNFVLSLKLLLKVSTV
jgi:hypothetical protein